MPATKPRHEKRVERERDVTRPAHGCAVTGPCHLSLSLQSRLQHHPIMHLWLLHYKSPPPLASSLLQSNIRSWREERTNSSREMSKEVMAEAEHPPAKDYHDPPPAPLLDLGELMLWSFYRALIAEFVATLLFLYVTVATVIGYKAQSQDDQCGGVGILGIAWAFGGMIFILVYCTAGISGSGFISLSTRRILEELPLLLSCCLLLIRWTHKPGRHVGSVPGAEGVAAARGDVHGGAVLGGHMRRYSKGTALGAEIIGTFVLVYTVFSATDPKRSARDSHVPVLAPLPIGFAVFMVHLATIPITGTGINPARSFGAAVIYNQHKPWHDHVMDLLGGSFRRSSGGGGVPPVRAEGGGTQSFGLVQEQPQQLKELLHLCVPFSVCVLSMSKCLVFVLNSP
ncbi:hypothetical protein BHE74_00011767 [Ensete ventricosum]|nr:hypothetical protein BHE74_00011767 [Ensete ventricosum]